MRLPPVGFQAETAERARRSPTTHGARTRKEALSTSLVPRSFFRDLDTTREELNRLFYDDALLPVDRSETETSVILKASVPGIKPEDLDVAIDRGMLTIRGEI